MWKWLRSTGEKSVLITIPCILKYLSFFIRCVWQTLIRKMSGGGNGGIKTLVGGNKKKKFQLIKRVKIELKEGWIKYEILDFRPYSPEGFFCSLSISALWFTRVMLIGQRHFVFGCFYGGDADGGGHALLEAKVGFAICPTCVSERQIQCQGQRAALHKFWLPVLTESLR